MKVPHVPALSPVSVRYSNHACAILPSVLDLSIGERNESDNEIQSSGR
jgi:hypothetical protein